MFECKTWSPPPEGWERGDEENIWTKEVGSIRNWRKLHREKLHDLYSSPNNTRVIKIMDGELDGQRNTHGRTKKYIQSFGRKPEETTTLVWHLGIRGKILLKRILKKKGAKIWTGIVWLRTNKLPNSKEEIPSIS